MHEINLIFETKKKMKKINVGPQLSHWSANSGPCDCDLEIFYLNLVGIRPAIFLFMTNS